MGALLEDRRRLRAEQAKKYRMAARERALRDTQRYRDRYPATVGVISEFHTLVNGDGSADQMADVQFYSNELKLNRGEQDEWTSEPCLTDEFHQKYRGDYGYLEHAHDYIQWLFPTRERGLNNRAQPLLEEEIKRFRSDEGLRRRLLISYEIVLDFWGMELRDKTTGEVEVQRL